MAKTVAYFYDPDVGNFHYGKRGGAGRRPRGNPSPLAEPRAWPPPPSPVSAEARPGPLAVSAEAALGGRGWLGRGRQGRAAPGRGGLRGRSQSGQPRGAAAPAHWEPRVCLTHPLLPPCVAGAGHPMKPHRLALTHSLVLHYGLYKKMIVSITGGDQQDWSAGAGGPCLAQSCLGGRRNSYV